MTTVYGVTFVGARDQIEKQLKDRGDVDPAECWLAASYLAKLVGDLVRTVLRSLAHLKSGARMHR